MDVPNEQTTNLVFSHDKSPKKSDSTSQRAGSDEGRACRTTVFWISTTAMLILVVIYLALRPPALTDCSTKQKQNLADIKPAEPPKATKVELDVSEAIEGEPQGEDYPPPAQEVVKVQEEMADNKHIRSHNSQQQKRQQRSLNLWAIAKEEKIQLLAQLAEESNISQLSYTPFLRSKDEETQQFFLDYENRSSILNWSGITLSPQTEGKLEGLVRQQLQARQEKFGILNDRYKAKLGQKKGYMGEFNKGITYQQFLRTLSWKKLTGSQIFSSSDEETKALQEEERSYYQEKYSISAYQQLPLCIVMPTYNNRQNLRFAWSIESILQQHYSNFRVVIIDDASKERTAESTAAYLNWRKADPEKYILVGAKEHRTALENIYYGVHKYCDYNQIFMIVDGDDELVGRQAFKVVNALYQQEKMYVLYSQFISYNPTSRKDILDIGISEDFPAFVQRSNSYRTFKHSYSQLRTMISDLILLERMASLKLKSGRFFELLYDNAIFYPAFEMACQNIHYLPEIFYWYNINTGVNDWYKAKTQFYKENRFGIELQKPYRCIEKQLAKALH